MFFRAITLPHSLTQCLLTPLATLALTGLTPRMLFFSNMLWLTFALSRTVSHFITRVRTAHSSQRSLDRSIRTPHRSLARSVGSYILSLARSPSSDRTLARSLGSHRRRPNVLALRAAVPWIYVLLASRIALRFPYACPSSPALRRLPAHIKSLAAVSLRQSATHIAHVRPRSGRRRVPSRRGG